MSEHRVEPPEPFREKQREHARRAVTPPRTWFYVGDIDAAEQQLRQAMDRIDVAWAGT